MNGTPIDNIYQGTRYLVEIVRAAAIVFPNFSWSRVCFLAARIAFARRGESATFDSNEFLHIASAVSYIQFTGFNGIISRKNAGHVITLHFLLRCIGTACLHCVFFADGL